MDRVGFQVFPPLVQVNEFVAWNKFLELISELFGSSVTVFSNRIVLTIRGEQALLPRDGIYFRELSFIRSPVSEKLVGSVRQIAAGYFPTRVFDIAVGKYSETQLNDSYQQFLAGSARCVEQLSTYSSSEFCVCAYCLQNVSKPAPNVCRTCSRRTYCSPGCMELDSDPEGPGQGHSMWCSLGVCEEGTEWSVEPVQGKGLGVVAKKHIPSRSRIMVDRPRHIGFPAVRDLEPIGGLLYEKERLNSFEVESESLLCLRVARINHACIPNAAQVFDADMGVMIVLANRDIKPGEEICISYLNSLGRSSPHTLESGRTLLEEKWNIKCNKDCGCRDTKFQNELAECRMLDTDISSIGCSREASVAIERIDNLLYRLDTLKVTWIWKLDLLWGAFEIAISDPLTAPRAREFARAALEICQSVFHPQSDRPVEMDSILRNPRSCYALHTRIAAQSA